MDIKLEMLSTSIEQSLPCTIRIRNNNILTITNIFRRPNNFTYVNIHGIWGTYRIDELDIVEVLGKEQDYELKNRNEI